MVIDTIQLIRNIGTFDSVDAGAHLPLSRFALIYAENGRGKTTLAAILRSLGSGDPLPILERKRLTAAHPPHVVIAGNGGQQAVFQNGAWSNTFDNIAVFDDQFVSDNVCSGMQIGSAQRQKLHELIIGARGVALSQSLQGHVDRVEQHNRDLQARAGQIPAEARGGMAAEAFCDLEPRDDLDAALQEAERNLAAATDADAVRQRAVFDPIILPDFDLASVETLLTRSLAELEAEAAARVQAHLAKLGPGAETWVSDGMRRVEGASADQSHAICPFCAQGLDGSPLIAHYQAYFSAAYRDLRDAIERAIHQLNTDHRAEIQATFERAIRVTSQTQQFWARYTDVAAVDLDTASIARAWKAAFEAVSSALLAKQSAPLEQFALDPDVSDKVAVYQALRGEVSELSDALVAANEQIAIVKEKAAAGNITALEEDQRKLRAIEARFRPEVSALCDDYLAEKERKLATERLRDEARQALDQYRNEEFPAYEQAINRYLGHFNAGYRLHQVTSVNTRGGSSCNYSVLIDNTPVPLSAAGEGEPSFRNTLSAGDRNALVLAFFFASLERDPDRARKIVVIDDPMTSLDEHRALTTVQQMRQLLEDVEQVIVLSHSKPFLCGLWEGADTDIRSALKIFRSNPGSSFAPWDVTQDCITEHDRRHRLVRDYLNIAHGPDERAVAAALRPILEAYMRVCYPEWFPPGTLLGPFLGVCQQYVGTPNEILSREDRNELRTILDYANRFHHNANAAWQTAVINDAELNLFARRTLAFTRRETRPVP